MLLLNAKVVGNFQRTKLCNQKKQTKKLNYLQGKAVMAKEREHTFSHLENCLLA